MQNKIEKNLSKIGNEAELEKSNLSQETVSKISDFFKEAKEKGELKLKITNKLDVETFRMFLDPSGTIFTNEKDRKNLQDFLKKLLKEEKGEIINLADFDLEESYPDNRKNILIEIRLGKNIYVKSWASGEGEPINFQNNENLEEAEDYELEESEILEPEIEIIFRKIN
jgi:hypothetical protein